MTRKHITRKYSAHRKSVVRPLEEYFGIEIFSYDHKDTMVYNRYDSNYYKVTNGNNVYRLAWSAVESADGKSRFEIDLKYVVDEFAEYRFDALYETKDSEDNIGFIEIYDSNGVKVDSESILMGGEKGVLKRVTYFTELSEDTYTVKWRMPYNTFFFGSIIRKLKVFTGDSLDSAGTNLLMTACSVTNSSATSPTEMTATIGFDNSLECAESPSGFYIDYRDEINVYAKDEDGEKKQIFGGYVSSILPSSDYTTISLTAADRLEDGVNKYILSAMVIRGGTASPTEWESDMYHDFNSYGGSLYFLCQLFETSLKNNINENYFVAGEKYAENISATFGSKGTVKNVPVSNMTCESSENFITLRNGSTSENGQYAYLYNYKDYLSEPIDITDYPNFAFTYGLGDPKTEEEITTTTDTSSSSSSTSANVNSEIITVVGKPSCGCCGYPKMAYKDYTRRWKNYCPNCGRKGSLRFNPKGVYEGEITCGDGHAPWTDGCDSDFCCVCGGDKAGHGKCARVKLTPASADDVEYTTGTSDGTSTSTTKITHGYDKDKPFQAYIQIDFSTDKVNVLSMMLNFTAKSNNYYTYEGITPIWINNVVKQGMVDVVEYMRSMPQSAATDDTRFYLHNVKLVLDPQTEALWETSDSSQDNSSRKIDIYGFDFNNGTLTNPKDLSSCGKTVVNELKEITETSGYLVEMIYAKHRKDDVINFKIDNQKDPVFTAVEGDDNNILSFNSISYTPVSNLFNSSIQVAKYKYDTETDKYYYCESKDATSISKYGQQSVLESSSEVVGKAMSYYKARTNSKFVPTEEFSYSLTLPYLQDLEIGDLVKITSDEKKLNTIKKISSVKHDFSISKIPHIQTTIGVGDLPPDLQLKKQLRELRESAKTESTLFSSSATGLDDPDVYMWER